MSNCAMSTLCRRYESGRYESDDAPISFARTPLLLQLVLGTRHADLGTHGIGYYKCCEWAKTVHQTKRPHVEAKSHTTLSEEGGPSR